MACTCCVCLCVCVCNAFLSAAATLLLAIQWWTLLYSLLQDLTVDMSIRASPSANTVDQSMTASFQPPAPPAVSAVDGGDSSMADDVNSMIGQAVRVEWSGGQSHDGVVCDKIEDHGGVKHLVEYADGDAAWHVRNHHHTHTPQTKRWRQCLVIPTR